MPDPEFEPQRSGSLDMLTEACNLSPGETEIGPWGLMASQLAYLESSTPSSENEVGNLFGTTLNIDLWLLHAGAHMWTHHVHACIHTYTYASLLL